MQQVTLSFMHKEYVVEPDRAWGLIEAIEDHVTMAWLAPRLQERQVPLVKIYKAYGAALEYAGAKGVSIDAIREGIDFKRGLEMAFELAGILSLASPPICADLGKQAGPKEVETVKKKQAVKSRKAVSKRG